MWVMVLGTKMPGRAKVKVTLCTRDPALFGLRGTAGELTGEV